MGTLGHGFFSLLIAIGWALFALLWLFVPFAIFGIKALLRQILAEQKRTNDVLSRVHGISLPPDTPAPQPFRPGRYP